MNDPMTTPGTPSATGTDGKSAGQLVKEVTEDFSTLVRKEIELAKQEVGASVAAKATALRTRAMAEAEAAAESASERMALPTVMLLVGFVIFIGYPAVAAVMSGF